jgi:hypothetical protein
VSTESARSSLLKSAHLTAFPTAIDEDPAADRASSADLRRVNPVVRLLQFRTHRKASPLQSDKEALMPMWIWYAYAAIVAIGIPAAVIFWFNGSSVGLATSLGGVFILSLVFFWLAMRAAGSLEPNRIPQG